MSIPSIRGVLRPNTSRDDDDFVDELDILEKLSKAPAYSLTTEEPGPAKPLIASSAIQEKRTRLFLEGSRFAPVEKKDIVGIDNVLEQVDEVIHWLTHYKEYVKHNARPEPGVLFEGQPGTGKTYTSRYMATISGAKFIDVRDFPYAGRTISAQDVKDLFSLARGAHKATGKPIILFWDEFESAARERGRSGVSVDQASVVSQLTAELDGVNGKPSGVLLVGCTNYADNIDMALKRSGRMGLHVEFNAPDRNGKKTLLAYYINKVKTKGPIDLDTASYFFNDWDTAATIEEAVQQAWRFAIKRFLTAYPASEGRRGKSPVLTESDLLEIFLERLVGPPPAFMDLTGDTLYRVAVHETGHALGSVLFRVPLRLVTVRPGREHLGKTMTYQIDPKSSTVAELLNQLRVGVAGVVAERVVGIERSAGAAGDTRSITEIAIDLVDSEGVGKRTGLLNASAMRKRHYNSSPSISTSIIDNSDLDVKSLLFEAEHEVEELFRKFGATNIAKLAHRLVEVQTLTGRAFEEEVKKLG